MIPRHLVIGTAVMLAIVLVGVVFIWIPRKEEIPPICSVVRGTLPAYGCKSATVSARKSEFPRSLAT